MTWYMWLGLAVAAYGLLRHLHSNDDDDHDPTLLGKDRFLRK